MVRYCDSVFVCVDRAAHSLDRYPLSHSIAPSATQRQRSHLTSSYLLPPSYIDHYPLSFLGPSPGAGVGVVVSVVVDGVCGGVMVLCKAIEQHRASVVTHGKIAQLL